ncbi:unnamed protein product [Oikopleura dioica]|uniref:Coenzyme Q-binding protein COQ10 START domain-containing protein n=1 Tax=Oikopleura dioica TaxID=34765 RepID=E4X6P5_OIKDI|nr:unnamed protein product [Oikopleura dioica]
MTRNLGLGSLRRSLATLHKRELATVYGVVADVANYSNFVPFCENSTLSSDKSSGQIDIKFGPIRNSWQSKLTFSEGEILAQNATSFPLKYLDTRWKFTPRKNGHGFENNLIFLIYFTPVGSATNKLVIEIKLKTAELCVFSIDLPFLC